MACFGGAFDRSENEFRYRVPGILLGWVLRGCAAEDFVWFLWQAKAWRIDGSLCQIEIRGVVRVMGFFNDWPMRKVGRPNITSVRVVIAIWVEASSRRRRGLI